MSDLRPAKGRPITVMRDEAPVERPRPVVKPQECRLGVRFYRRMRANHVYPLIVQVPSASWARAGIAPAPVRVRPIIPGAHVVPTETELDLARPGTCASFYVTPLARGKLAGARIEVHQNGALAQEVPLSMKAVTQRLTYWLAALTILLPAFLLYATKYHPLRLTESRSSNPAGNGGKGAPKLNERPLPGFNVAPPPVGVNNRADDQRNALKLEGNELVLLDAQDKAKEQAETKGKAQPKGKANADDKAEPKNKSEEKGKKAATGEQPPPVPGRNRDKEAAPPEEKDEAADRSKEPERPRGESIQLTLPQGESLRRVIDENVPDIPGDFVSDETKKSLADRNIRSFTRSMSTWLGDGYDLACSLARDHLSFYVGLVLLLLTVLSWLTHFGARGRRWTKPIVVPTSEASSSAV